MGRNIENLKQQVESAISLFSLVDERNLNFCHRLMDSLRAIETQHAERRGIVTNLESQVENLTRENEQLETMLKSLLGAVGAGGDNRMDEIRQHLEAHATRIAGEKQAAMDMPESQAESDLAAPAAEVAAYATADQPAGAAMTPEFQPAPAESVMSGPGPGAAPAPEAIRATGATHPPGITHPPEVGLAPGPMHTPAVAHAPEQGGFHEVAAAPEQGGFYQAAHIPEQQAGFHPTAPTPEQQDRFHDTAPEQQAGFHPTLPAPEHQDRFHDTASVPEQQAGFHPTAPAPEQQDRFHEAAPAPEQQGSFRPAAPAPEHQGRFHEAARTPEQQGRFHEAATAPEQQGSFHEAAGQATPQQHEEQATANRAALTAQVEAFRKAAANTKRRAGSPPRPEESGPAAPEPKANRKIDEIVARIDRRFAAASGNKRPANFLSRS